MTKMATRRFLVFAGDNYYPAGGWSDLFGTFDTRAEAEAAAAKADGETQWSEIIDLEELDADGNAPTK